jgi:hypothetical protein
MPFTVQHSFVSGRLPVHVDVEGGFATVRCSASGKFDVRYACALRVIAQATYTVTSFDGTAEPGEGALVTMERPTADSQ